MSIFFTSYDVTVETPTLCSIISSASFSPSIKIILLSILYKTTTFPTEAIAKQTVSKHGRRITLSEASKIADQMQDRIDAAYQQELESEAQLTVVWEQGE